MIDRSSRDNHIYYLSDGNGYHSEDKVDDMADPQIVSKTLKGLGRFTCHHDQSQSIKFVILI